MIKLLIKVLIKKFLKKIEIVIMVKSSVMDPILLSTFSLSNIFYISHFQYLFIFNIFSVLHNFYV